MVSFKKCQATLTFLEKCLVKIAALSLFSIMLIVVADVFMRYVFNSPFIWSYELISMYLMVIVFFFSLSNTLEENGHIAVDFLHIKISERTRHLFLAIGYWCSLVVFCIVFYASVHETWISYMNKDVIDGLIEWPKWLSWLSVPIGTSLLIARILFRALGHTFSAMTNSSHIELPLISGHEKE